jgi:hypothetical protein
MNARLGEILVQDGACTEAAVREALQNQAIFGARLGTNLLELGALTEEALALALGKQSGVPALYGDLPPDAHALRLLDKRVADRWDVVPYLVADRKLAILARDPGDIRMLDEVAFAVGRSVHPFVVPEARIWQALRRAYGLDREHRGMGGASRRTLTPPPMPAVAIPEAESELMDEAEFQALYGREEGKGPTLTPAPMPAVTAARAVGTPRASPDPPLQAPTPDRAAAADARPAHLFPRRRSAAPPAPAAVAYPDVLPPPLTLQDLDLIAATPGHAPPAAPPSAGIAGETREAPEPSALSFGDALRFLEGVDERSTIARTVLRHARTRFARAILFTVHAGEAHGWAGLGAGLTPEAVHAIRIPLRLPGVLETVVTARSHFLGPLPRTWSNIRLLKGLGGGVPRNALLVPIVARGRVVNVLYGDRGRGELVDAAGLGELLVLAARIAQSYDALAGRAV